MQPSLEVVISSAPGTEDWQMLPRWVKAAFYTAARVPMGISADVYRYAFAPRSGHVRVQLGPGQRNHLIGWINVDANVFTAKPRPQVWADLRNPLPFRPDTVDCFYSHHVIEHLPDYDLPGHMAQMFRCLKPGGVIRIGGPNGTEAARQLLAGNTGWFGDFPDSRKSVGGRYANFILCRGEHLTILTESYLEELLVAAGFVDITPRRPVTDTGYPSLFDAAVMGLEQERTPETPHTLLVEARKPGGD